MIRGKYGALIGLKEPIAWQFILGVYKKSRFQTNHSGVFTPYHRTTESRQTTVKTTVVDPPTLSPKTEAIQPCVSYENALTRYSMNPTSLNTYIP